MAENTRNVQDRKLKELSEEAIATLNDTTNVLGIKSLKCHSKSEFKPLKKIE
jgi:hypothetical protein